MKLLKHPAILGGMGFRLAFMQNLRSVFYPSNLSPLSNWVVVKIMVPFWVPIIVRHLIFRVPKKGP